MPSSPVPRRALAAAAALSLVTGLFAAAPAQAAPADQQRQHDFAAAASEFGVPLNVLLGVSYLESRWDFNAGTPSTAAGYGPMHLTDVRAAGTGTEHDEGADPRGDDARHATGQPSDGRYRVAAHRRSGGGVAHRHRAEHPRRRGAPRRLPAPAGRSQRQRPGL